MTNPDPVLTSTLPWLDALPDPGLLVDLVDRGRVRHANPAAARYFGADLPALGGQFLWDLWPDLAAHLAPEGSPARTFRLRGGGPWAWVDVRTFPAGDLLAVQLTDATAQRAAEVRAGALSELATALSQALTPGEAAAVLGRGLAALEADAGSVFVLDAEREELVFTGAVGDDEADLTGGHRFPVSAPTLLGDVLRAGEGLFLTPAEVDARPPHPGVRRRVPTRAVAALPLLFGGRAVGVMTFGFAGDHTFDPAERLFLRALAEGLAQALERARLLARERQARERASLLARAGEVLSVHREPQEVLDTLTGLVVPGLADWCNVALPDERGLLTLRAVAHTDPARVELVRRFRERVPVPVDGDNAVARVFRSGEGRLIPELEDPAALVPELAQDPEFARTARAANVRSMILVPLTARGETLGVLSLISGTPGRFGPDDLALAEDLARRAALALDNAQLRASLLRERERLTAVLEQMPVAVWLAEVPGGRLLFGNRTSEEWLGLAFQPSGSVEEYGAYTGFRPDGTPYAPREWPMSRVLAGEDQIVGEEIDMLRGDGTRVPLSFNAALVRDAAGAPILAVVVAQDIRERKRAELQLRAWSGELERQVAARTEELRAESVALAAFAAFTEAVGGAADQHDLARRACEVLHTTFGDGTAVYYEPDGGMWRGVTWAGDFPEGTLAVIRQGLPADTVGIARSVEARDVVFIDGWRDEPDDVARQTREYGTAAFSPVIVGGEVVGLLTAGLKGQTRWGERERAVVRGVGHGLNLAAERATFVQTLREQERQLRAANEELGAFAYTVSHDLRAPVRHVGSFAGLLRRKMGDDPGLLRYVDQIEGAASRMETLTDALLGLARAGAAQLDKTDVDLNLLVRAARSDLTPELAGREIVWQVGGLPTVRADVGLLRQVLTNLLGNAVKYSRGREPAVVEVWAEQTPAEVIVTVRDNGAGFDPQYAGKLFGVFQRLHLQSEFEGTGVGLANVRRIVEKHGGRVWASARPGEGATFSFSLPNA